MSQDNPHTRKICLPRAGKRPVEKHSILPVFLPFQGCRHRCIYCAQDLQTGRGRPGLEAILNDFRNSLKGKGPWDEAAFFGGTFTALDDSWQDRFLGEAARAREKGIIRGVRCSTRPDRVGPETLARLKNRGMDTVELGVQSFRDRALNASGRGYSGEEARAACRRVPHHGLDLVIQLLPGLPGQDEAGFLDDVETAADLDPHGVRLYPCLVIEGSPLARRWREGGYRPWELNRTVDILAKATARFWRAGIPVIRTGLASQPGLDEAVLAGPRHPALGGMVKSRALYHLLAPSLREHAGRVAGLTVPAGLQGCFFGHRAELARKWEELGLFRSEVAFADQDHFLLRLDGPPPQRGRP